MMICFSLKLVIFVFCYRVINLFMIFFYVKFSSEVLMWMLLFFLICSFWIILLCVVWILVFIFIVFNMISILFFVILLFCLIWILKMVFVKGVVIVFVFWVGVVIVSFGVVFWLVGIIEVNWFCEFILMLYIMLFIFIL